MKNLDFWELGLFDLTFVVKVLLFLVLVNNYPIDHYSYSFLSALESHFQNNLEEDWNSYGYWNNFGWDSFGL